LYLGVVVGIVATVVERDVVVDVEVLEILFVVVVVVVGGVGVVEVLVVVASSTRGAVVNICL